MVSDVLVVGTDMNVLMFSSDRRGRCAWAGGFKRCRAQKVRIEVNTEVNVDSMALLQAIYCMLLNWIVSNHETSGRALERDPCRPTMHGSGEQQATGATGHLSGHAETSRRTT